MNLKIDRLYIHRFKKLTDFELKLSGKSALILGRNAIGKTTIIDAIHWLFTGHDSGQRGKFGVLEIDQDGNFVDHKNAIVELSLLTGNGPVVLKKEFRQKWTKKRGQAKKEMTGHTTKYFFNEVPVPKKEYDKKISELIDPFLFLCLIDPYHFCNRISNGDRRKMLVNLIDEKKINIDKPEILNRYSFEEAMAILKANRKTANDSMAIIPHRIDELNRMKPDISGLPSKEAIEKELIELGQADSSVLLKHESYKVTSALEKAYHKNKSAIRHKLSETDFIIKERITKRMQVVRRIETLSGRKDKARDRWIELNKKVYKSDDSCFACGQKIPDEIKKEQEKAFLDANQKEKDEISKKGQTLLKQIEAAEEEKSIIDTEKETAIKEKEGYEKALATLKSDYDKSIKIAANELGKKIAEISAKKKSDPDWRKRLDDNLFSHSQFEKIDKQIRDRQKELSQASIEYEKIEREIINLEAYSIKRSKLIEKEVNLKFNLIKWRLFEHQINGGMREICEPLVNGISYNQDLNTGAKINAGIDAVKSLSQYTGNEVFLLIDNAESVTNWEPFNGQSIRMIADSDFKTLTVKLI